MKKLLLSSIIMFGICGFVTAQNATGSKLGKTTTPATTSATPTPQKSAVEAPAATTNSDARPEGENVKTADAVAPAATDPAGKARVKKTEAAAITNADGTVTTDAQDAQKKQAARQTAPAVKKN